MSPPEFTSSKKILNFLGRKKPKKNLSPWLIRYQLLFGWPTPMVSTNSLTNSVWNLPDLNADKQILKTGLTLFIPTTLKWLLKTGKKGLHPAKFRNSSTV